MPSQLQFFLSRLRERLWVKPVLACILSMLGVLLAHLADSVPVHWKVPEIAQSSVIDLLKIIASSMLGVATFAVASMVAAYVSTSQSATARAFPLIVADDVSQNALSIFVGAFIFGIVALSASTNDYFGKAGRFTLFVMTLLVLATVVLVFVRWVDNIARLGRLGSVMDTVESVTAQALGRRRLHPYLGGMAANGPPCGLVFHAEESGYLQRIDMASLQRMASQCGHRITVAVLPGAQIAPARPLGYLRPDPDGAKAIDLQTLRKAFILGPGRHFDEDPRFGLVVLAEIGGRALSKGINDPGTGIGVLGALQRLFAQWASRVEAEEPEYDRIEVPALSLDDMFDDVIPAIARDGAGTLEVAERLQRVLGELGACGDPQLRLLARRHARLALQRSEQVIDFGPDLERLRRRHRDYWEPSALTT